MANYDEYIENNSIDYKINKSLNYFWAGFVIYAVSYPISFGDPSANKVFFYLQLLGLLIFAFASIPLIRFHFENKYLKYTFLIYITWLIIVILRGFVFERAFLINLFFNATHGIFLYFVPLILLFPLNIIYLKKVFNVITITGLFYFIYVIFYFQKILASSLEIGPIIEHIATLSIPSGFFLLTYIYHTGKRKILAFVIIALNLLLAAISARRGLGFMSVSILAFAYLIYYNFNRRRLIQVIISLSLISVIIIIGIKIYKENSSQLFGLLTERFEEDTRSGVQEYFYGDMSIENWVIGKGINGKYYCPNIQEDLPTDDRSVIETGYLQIILKGGILSLVLLLLIAIPAMIKGIFYSKNILSKASGVWILLALIDLYPATVVTFSLNYILVWISIGLCYSDEIRNLTDEDIKNIWQINS